MATATGTLSLARHYARESLAACSTWISETGAADAAEAKKRIFYNGLPKPREGATHSKEELIAYRPYAIVYTLESEGLTKAIDAIGTAHEFHASGSVMVHIVRNCPDADGDEPSAVANETWENALGKIIDELGDLAGQAGYLAATSIMLADGPFWTPRDRVAAEGIWQGADIQIDWG